MKNAVIYGAGQMGTMLARLLAGDTRIVCFADGNAERWGSLVNGIPVVSPEESLRYMPDLYCLGVLDDERAFAMESKLRELNYTGPVIRYRDTELFDVRVAAMRLLAEQIEKENIPGDVAELGVYRGDFAKYINLAFPSRKLHLYDTFAGFPEADASKDRKNGDSYARAKDFSGTDVSLVMEKMPYPEQVILHPGYFPDTFHEEKEQFCFISLDPDLYEPTLAGLERFWPQLAGGGSIMLHDYHSGQYKGAARAADAFLSTRPDACCFPLCDLHGSLIIKKTGTAG